MTEGKQVQDFIKSQKKNVREMFEEAGYEYEFKKDVYIAYSKEKDCGLTFEKILFDLGDKTFYADKDYESMNIDMETLKLIIAQCKELGWLK